MRALARVLGTLLILAGWCPAALAQEQALGSCPSAPEGVTGLSAQSASPRVCSITGRLTDAVSGQPLSGVARPFASALLYACDALDCSIVNAQEVDADGRFRFDRDRDGEPLSPGTYEIQTSARGYASSPARFTAAEHESRELGDLAVEPPGVLVTDVRRCAPLRAAGGRCEYSVRIQNGSKDVLRGTARSLVDVFSASFEASVLPDGDLVKVRRAVLEIPPRSSQIVSFFVDVPPLEGVPSFCTMLYVGLEPSLLFNTLHPEILFCSSDPVELQGLDVERSGARRQESRALR